MLKVAPLGFIQLKSVFVSNSLQVLWEGRFIRRFVSSSTQLRKPISHEPSKQVMKKGKLVFNDSLVYDDNFTTQEQREQEFLDLMEKYRDTILTSKEAAQKYPNACYFKKNPLVQKD